MDTDPAAGAATSTWFNPGVRSIGLASFLSDVGHEIPTSLLPSFLTVTLGAPASALGLIEGVADLAFEEKDGWIVVDFKTDAEIAGRLDLYKRQVGIYTRAISAATGRPAVGVLVHI